MHQTLMSYALRAVGATALAVVLGAGSALADAADCQEAIAKAGQKYADQYSKNLAKCEASVLKGKIPGPCPDTKAAEKIAKALTKLQDTIAKDCTDVSLVDIGWDDLASRCNSVGNRAGSRCDDISDCPGVAGRCQLGSNPGTVCTIAGADPLCLGGGTCLLNSCDPVDECAGLLNAACDNALSAGPGAALATDLSTCVACTAEQSGDDLIEATYGLLTTQADDDAEKCRADIGKRTQKAYAAIRKALLKGDPAKVAAAVTKLKEQLAKQCTASNIALALNEIGLFGQQAEYGACAPTPPFSVTTLGDSLACVAQLNAQCAHDLTTNTLSEACNSPDCGDGLIKSPETCDDGNTRNEGGTGPIDTCPSDCAVAACTETTNQQVTVSLTSTVALTGATVVLYYDDAKVSMPGLPGPISPANIAGIPDWSAAGTDVGYALRALVTDDTFAGLPSGPALTLTFKRCSGAPAPVAGDFDCYVADAADAAFAVAYGATCSVSVP